MSRQPTTCSSWFVLLLLLYNLWLSQDYSHYITWANEMHIIFRADHKCSRSRWWERESSLLIGKDWEQEETRKTSAPFPISTVDKWMRANCWIVDHHDQQYQHHHLRTRDTQDVLEQCFLSANIIAYHNDSSIRVENTRGGGMFWLWFVVGCGLAFCYTGGR